jgi:hypothetical protein
LIIIIITFISTVLTLFLSTQQRRPRKYLPLGLEELEGATELRGGTDDEDDDDDAFSNDPMFASRPTFSGSSGGRRTSGAELAFEAHPDDSEPRGQRTSINGGGNDEDDFNPRSSDDERAASSPSPTPASPSLLDL